MSVLLQAIPSYSARRSLFEHYVKTRAEEERKEKRAAQKAAIEGFKQLLDEVSEVSSTTLNTPPQKKKTNPTKKNTKINVPLAKSAIFCAVESADFLLSTFSFSRMLITVLIIKLSERNGAMIHGLRPCTARIESIY